MNYRKLSLGDKNIIGAQVAKARMEMGLLQKELLARLQIEGMDISITALSLLEGQKRPVYDFELVIISKVLGKDIEWLLGSYNRT